MVSQVHLLWKQQKHKHHELQIDLLLGGGCTAGEVVALRGGGGPPGTSTGSVMQASEN